MKKPGYYSSGEFARMAHLTLRTIRYYDKQNILKPSYVTEAGARFYTDEDFARLQQILLLKYLGFSLDDIRDMTIDDADYHFMLNSLNIQLKLVRDRIEQMQLVEQAIQDTSDLIQKEHSVDWSQMLNLIHLTGMEKSMKNQYQDASNISARINLHSLYSQNTKGWFPWIFEQLELKPGMKVLELGCGDGTLWNVDRDKIPEQTEIVVSDISDGMLRDARRTIGADDSRFRFRVFDAGRIPYDEDSFDLVIANHVLFYCEDIPKVCKEVKRVLKPGGRFVCSTYGNDHMREVSELVQKFDDRIVLAAKNLYERFGKENGEEILVNRFVYKLKKPKANDVIVFLPNGNEKSHYYVKRVIGVPGDKIQIKNGAVYVNGELFDEKADTAAIEDAGLASEEITVGEDEYFVLGDNRNSSEDSRYANIGNVKREYIIGKAWFRISPLRKIGFIK